MTLNDLAQGVIAGLVTGILIWLFRAVWLKILSPFIEDLLYRGVRIEGLWIAELVGAESTHKEEIVIKQWGNRVAGTLKCIEGQDQNSSYSFSGTFKNLILTAMYESTDKFSTDRGTFTVRLEDNGSYFKGHTVYLGATDGELSDAAYVWNKKA
ncbi:MAG TPA: hypothetical protein VGU61_12380 [Noviherbaspirillum sp.]|jgi:hypothetical protein|uniref:hypothetical protein n=1 Tax=Noviherbaspirillum sp. TaxID=1926288 RepID=UPI002DDCB88B|nr:hypothetical protein [Noviherbaspirillum sp.]HEV2611057.1 hypothetical protein [Noviherbaspirillum sp.]